jgi:hypothetical protein
MSKIVDRPWTAVTSFNLGEKRRSSWSAKPNADE